MEYVFNKGNIKHLGHFSGLKCFKIFIPVEVWTFMISS